jgi:hypothetical protein
MIGINAIYRLKYESCFTFLTEGRADRQSKSWPFQRDQKLRRGGEGDGGSSSSSSSLSSSPSIRGHGTCRSSFKVARAGLLKPPPDSCSECEAAYRAAPPATGDTCCVFLCWKKEGGLVLMWRSSTTSSSSILVSCTSRHCNPVICISRLSTSTSSIAISSKSFCSCTTRTHKKNLDQSCEL